MLIKHNYEELWEQHLLPKGLPLLLGAILGVLLAFSITREIWLVMVVSVTAIPAILVLNKYPILAIMLWFAGMSLIPFTVSPQVFWVIHRALIPLALGLTILPRILKVKDYEPVKLGWPELSMVVYLIIAAVSIVITRNEPLPSLYELYDRTLVPFTAYWLIRFINPNEQLFKRWLPLIVTICIAEITIGFWARYLPHTLPPLWTFKRMGNRMSGTFGNPTPYAYILMFCMVFIFHHAIHYGRPGKRVTQIFLLSIFGAGLVSIFLTFTRGSWVAAFLVMIGLLYLYPKPVLTLSAIALPIFLALSINVLANEVITALTRLNTGDTIDSRIVLAHAGQEMFFAKPVFGWGFDNYDRYDWQFMERVGNSSPTGWDIKYGTSHNTYLTILAEMGTVGFFFQFFPLFWWFIQSVKAWGTLPRQGYYSRQLLFILWLSVIFYLVSSQVVDMRFFWFSIGTWWLSLGLIANLVQTLPRQNNFSLQSSAKQNEVSHEKTG